MRDFWDFIILDMIFCIFQQSTITRECCIPHSNTSKFSESQSLSGPCQERKEKIGIGADLDFVTSV